MVVFCKKGNVIFNSSGELEVVEKKKMTKNKNIKNVIFDNMRKYTTDPFWDNFLAKASRNIFPPGFSFREDILFYSQKPKTNMELILDETKLEISFVLFKKFMAERGIISKLDKEHIRKEYGSDITEKYETFDTWKELGRSQQDVLYKYKNYLREKYSLTKPEFLYLTSVINIGISSGILCDATINVKESKITEIENLVFDEQTRKFKIESDDIKIKKSKNTSVDNYVETSTTCNTTLVSKSNNISKLWDNFVETVLHKNK